MSRTRWKLVRQAYKIVTYRRSVAELYFRVLKFNFRHLASIYIAGIARKNFSRV